ncbi:MAG: hypothetical protein DRI48_07765 [Chloroflexi bacterium]|nr:MAG: hypothetical protein DRI48_07765 [Chloroflexota bacterium]
MREREGSGIPDWAERERVSDLVWIWENLHVFWPTAQQGYKEFGRGAIVVDTTCHPAGKGNPFIYLPQGYVEETDDIDAQRMVREYDPTWEFVTVLLKLQYRVSVYRVRIPSQRSQK